MKKVLIEKRKYDSLIGCECLSDTVSIDATKPDDLTEEEWGSIKTEVWMLANAEKESITDFKGPGCLFDLECITDDKEWGILAESEHFYIRNEFEAAVLFSKPNSKRITSVGDFYGDPHDAYIDPEERFCLVVGCGIIKYNLCDPFEEYLYDKDTPQWIETGREGNIEWCDCIEAVTDSYFVVSCEGEDKRKFSLETLEKEEV